MQGLYVDPIGMLSSERVPYHEAVMRLMNTIEPMCIRLGSEDYIAFVSRILEEGTGAEFLRQRYKKSKSLKDVVQSLQGEFWL